MRRKAIITAALFLMLGGLWWQFKGRPDAAKLETSAPATTAEEEDYFSQETKTPVSEDSTPAEGVNPESLQTPTEAATCQPIQQGYGVAMQDWKTVTLPYADQWPKNKPGEPVDCAPDSDLGAAVVATHSLYLEFYSPELIPQIAADTPGRKIRIERHEGKSDPAEDDDVCQPLGWDKRSGASVWYILHQCEAGAITITSVRMERSENTWLLTYDVTGRIAVDIAPPGIEYFPFEGGD